MPVLTREAWKLWHEERARFKKRESQGFEQDLSALKIHIMKLQDLAPKDKAGWPVGDALSVISDLQRDYSRFTRLLEQLR